MGVALVAVRLPHRDYMSPNEVKRHLAMLALQVRGEPGVAEVKEKLKKDVPFWQIALDLGASPQLIAELGGPRI